MPALRERLGDIALLSGHFLRQHCKESGREVLGFTEDAMAASDVLVAATGTATLEAAVLGVPMVAVYHLPWLSWEIAKRIASVPYAALPNILARQEIVPELLQGRMRSDAIAETVGRLLDDPQRRAAMRTALRQVVADLGPPGAAARAAHHVVMQLSGASIAGHESEG